MNSSLIKTTVFAAGLALTASGCQFLDNQICERPAGEVISQTLDLADYNSLDVRDIANVFLQQGDAFEVVAEGQQAVLDRMDVRVESGKLIIDVDGCFLGNPTFNVYVTMPESTPLESVEVSGAADLETMNPITVAEEFRADISGAADFTMATANSIEAATLDVSGAADADVSIKASGTYVSISGAGDVKVSGATKEFLVSISGDGDLLAFDYPAESVSIDVSGSGDAEVNVEGEDLTVDISGAGSVMYKGSPSNVNTRITGAGELVHVN